MNRKAKCILLLQAGCSKLERNILRRQKYQQQVADFGSISNHMDLDLITQIQLREIIYGLWDSCLYAFDETSLPLDPQMAS